MAYEPEKIVEAVKTVRSATEALASLVGPPITSEFDDAGNVEQIVEALADIEKRHADRVPAERPLDDLLIAVETAIKAYDASGDHKHYAGVTGDCIRCKLATALPHFVGKDYRK